MPKTWCDPEDRDQARLSSAIKLILQDYTLPGGTTPATPHALTAFSWHAVLFS